MKAYAEKVIEGRKAPGDPDWGPECECILATVFNWGHCVRANDKWMQQYVEAATSGTEMAQDEHHRPGFMKAGKGKTTEERARNYTEYVLTCSEYAMNLQNDHLWLGDSDADWHHPLIFTLRPRGEENQRNRSAAAQKRRAQRAVSNTGYTPQQLKERQEQRRGRGCGSGSGSGAAW